MSSNYPYGGRQPTTPGQRVAPGTGPGAQPSPYWYPQQPPPGRAPTATGYSFGPFAPDQEQGGWPGTQPRPYGDPADPYGDPADPYEDSADPYGEPTRQYPADPYGEPTRHYGNHPRHLAPPPNGKGKVLIIIGAVALAVILMAVIAVVVATRGLPGASPRGTATQAGQANSSQSGAPLAKRPSDAVAAYLQALADGDATTALSYAADPAPKGPLLTDKVLARSLERTPLTDIDVPVVEDQNANSVSATYRLGSSSVSESFDVVKVADSWRLSRIVKDLDVSFIVDGPIPVKINGVEVTDESVAVLPGSYAFTTGLPYVGYGSKNVVLVKSPYGQADTFSIQSQLTSAGEEAAVKAAKKSYNECLEANSLNPDNCPQKFNTKYDWDKSTINWEEVGNDPFQKAEVTFSGTQARIEIPINLKPTGSCTYQGRSGNCSGTLTGTSVAVIKVTSKPPLKVKWL
jgi:hypothetical protein